MIDLLSVVFGIIVTLLVLFVIREFLMARPQQVVIPSDIANDIVGESPYCPDCLSTDLELIDRYSGVTWIRGKDDGDCYSCRHCGRRFSDENWKDVKSTEVDLSGVQD
jgi:hypothetical protein